MMSSYKMLIHPFACLQDGNEVFFRIKRSTQLKKLMNAYCDRQSVEFNSIAFLFDGRRLRGEQTPDEVCFTLSLSPLFYLSFLTFISFCCYSWKWRMGMRQMQCYIKQVVLWPNQLVFRLFMYQDLSGGTCQIRIYLNVTSETM